MAQRAAGQPNTGQPATRAPTVIPIARRGKRPDFQCCHCGAGLSREEPWILIPGYRAACPACLLSLYGLRLVVPQREPVSVGEEGLQPMAQVASQPALLSVATGMQRG